MTRIEYNERPINISEIWVEREMPVFSQLDLVSAAEWKSLNKYQAKTSAYPKSAMTMLTLSCERRSCNIHNFACYQNSQELRIIIFNYDLHAAKTFNFYASIPELLVQEPHKLTEIRTKEVKTLCCERLKPVCQNETNVLPAHPHVSEADSEQNQLHLS